MAEAKTATKSAPKVDLPDELSGFTAFRDKKVIWAAYGGEEAGWFIRDQDGNDSQMDDEEFAATYTEIPPAKWDEGISKTPPRKKES